MKLTDYQRQIWEGEHSMDYYRACSACGDMDGCWLVDRVNTLKEVIAEPIPIYKKAKKKKK